MNKKIFTIPFLVSISLLSSCSSSKPKLRAFSCGDYYQLQKSNQELLRQEEELFMANLEQNDPDLASEVKKYRITFESIFEIFPDNLLCDLMNAVDLDAVAMALKGMDQAITDKVLGVLPKKK